MSDFSNLQKITKQAIIQKYNLTERQYSNLRKRYSERLINAKELYKWTDEDVPSITRLIDYSLKYKKQKVEQFEIILETPTTRKISIKTRRKALDIYSGYAGAYNKGFYSFSQGITQFEIMYANAEKRLSKNWENTTMEKLEHFKVGVKFSKVHNYYFKNNEYGRMCVNQINSIFNAYNSVIEYSTPQNALSIYITTIRRIMEVLHFADEHDAMAGSP